MTDPHTSDEIYCLKVKMPNSTLKRRPINIKLAMRKSYVFLSSFTIIYLVVLCTGLIIQIYLPAFKDFSSPVILFTALIVFPKLQKNYFRFANRYFFSCLYDSQEVIARLGVEFKSSLEIEKISYFLSELFLKTFHVRAYALLLFDEKTSVYQFKHSYGFNKNNIESLTIDHSLLKPHLEEGKILIIKEAIRHFGSEKEKNAMQNINALGVAVITPLNIKGRIIGIIALGEKVTQDPFNQDDEDILEIIGTQTAIVVENALLYEETREFNKKLKNEVERATKELKKANHELVKLDEAKSDFISIASHQLRTPLTVIKGYVSMLLEGSFGKLSIEEENSLRKVFESNERLIRLVENLLNISRIESGRMTYQFQSGVRLDEIVTSVCGELAQSADQKRIRLDYSGIEPNLPAIYGDSQKLRQVILNLIDNSLKYTRSGSIKISVMSEDGAILCAVKDTGIGFSDEDKRRLFKKFSRGKEISFLYTEGTGLGLYVAKMIIMEHKGKIWAESGGHGKGSEFYFSLPIKTSVKNN
jgi:signal transduction histidine kinase